MGIGILIYFAMLAILLLLALWGMIVNQLTFQRQTARTNEVYKHNIDLINSGNVDSEKMRSYDEGPTYDQEMWSLFFLYGFFK